MSVKAKTVEAESTKDLDKLINEIGGKHKIVSVSLSTTLERDPHLGRNFTTYTAIVLYE